MHLYHSKSYIVVSHYHFMHSFLLMSKGEKKVIYYYEYTNKLNWGIQGEFIYRGRLYMLTFSGYHQSKRGKMLNHEFWFMTMHSITTKREEIMISNSSWVMLSFTWWVLVFYCTIYPQVKHFLKILFIFQKLG